MSNSRQIYEADVDEINTAQMSFTSNDRLHDTIKISDLNVIAVSMRYEI